MKPVTLERFFAAMQTAHNGILPLDPQQKLAFHHDYRTPLWMIAGPGTGKTHTITWLVLKRMLVDRIDPSRIIFTTFTNKAANELQTRLIDHYQKLLQAGLVEAMSIDPTKIRLGTLHSICTNVLREQRYEPTMRINLLDDENKQKFFLQKTYPDWRHPNPLLKKENAGRLKLLLEFFQFWWDGKKQGFDPPSSRKVEFVAKLFSRAIENHVGIEPLRRSTNVNLQFLGEGLQDYHNKLAHFHFTDQSMIQKHFLDFLNSEDGREWIGSGFTMFVDEYQDTNPIQSEIYFALTGRRGDLSVVGDDDQSLYRFRGATVESLILFDQICMAKGLSRPQPLYLFENRRSHPAIVDWINRFISTHPTMHPIGSSMRVRAPGKPNIVSRSNIRGQYPALLALTNDSIGTRDDHDALKAANLIQYLKTNHLIEDYSQVAILSFSTAEDSAGLAAYTSAFRAAGIPYFNPRSKQTQEHPVFRQLLGAISLILQPEHEHHVQPEFAIRKNWNYLVECRQMCRTLCATHRELAAYIETSVEEIRQKSTIFRAKNSRYPEYLTNSRGRRVSFSHLWFKLIGFEPFLSQLSDMHVAEKLKALNNLIVGFEAIYDQGELKLATAGSPTLVDGNNVIEFCNIFIDALIGGVNEPEDDESAVRKGYVNIMTIHQSKGLEFDVVFVLKSNRTAFASDTHGIERIINPLRPPHLRNPHMRSDEERVAEDNFRLYFVAYSRAKKLLCINGVFPLAIDDYKLRMNPWGRVLPHTERRAMIGNVQELRKIGVTIL